MWEEIYRQAFPAFACMNDVRNDGWAQRGGIDRVIVLSSGKTVTVDEKIRRRSYADFCLEYKHDFYDGHSERGWVAKDLACDFIAYGWEPLGVAYLLPFHQLRRAWRDNAKAWVGQFHISRAENGRYVSIGCCVPVQTLLSAIADAMRVEWKPKTEGDNGHQGALF